MLVIAVESRVPLPFRSLYLVPNSAPGAVPPVVTVTVKLCVVIPPRPSEAWMVTG